MVTEVPAIAGPPSLKKTSIPVGESSDFDERWAARQAKAAAHDRTVRRKMAFAAPKFLVAAVVLYALLGH
jgi:hypothetical protein